MIAEVEREDARKLIVGHLTQTLPRSTRVRYPGQVAIDFTKDKSLYVNVNIVYMDGRAIALGEGSPTRRMGLIVTEVNFKDGDPKDYVLANNTLDLLEKSLSNTDAMKPVRTYGSRQESPTNGSTSGWNREALLTPFWYDTSK